MISSRRELTSCRETGALLSASHDFDEPASIVLSGKPRETTMFGSDITAESGACGRSNRSDFTAFFDLQVEQHLTSTRSFF